jgi:uncharacterized cupredoxin-like copper-binding protein
MKRMVLVLAAVGALLLSAACGDDDDATVTPEATTTGGTDDGVAETDGATGEDGEEAAGDFCAAYTELLAGDPEPDDMREVAEVAPPDAAEQLEAIATGFEEDEQYFMDPQFEEQFAALGESAVAECADSEVEVTATDYEFSGVPESVDAGMLGVTFVNDGAELHELIVMRKNDDTTESAEEIVEMMADGPDAASDLVTEVGGAFAQPGGRSSSLMDLDEPGDYLAVCFIPVGSTDFDTEGEGPSHAEEGMWTEFTVS